MMECITRLSNACGLHQPKCGKRWLIDCRCYSQSIVSLVSCDCFTRHRSKEAIDRPIVITGARQLFLNIDGHPVRRQIVVAIDWPVVHVTHRRRITPCREPVARVPVVPAVVHEDDPIVMASPPTTIVPLPVVITECRIPLTSERVTTPVISDSSVASSIVGAVRGPVDREVTIPINWYGIAAAKFIRVAVTTNVGVPAPVNRDV